MHILRYYTLPLAVMTLGCAHQSGGAEGAAEPAPAPAPAPEPAAKVAAGQEPMRPPTTGQEVAYSAGPTTLKGYLVYPTNATGKRPGVLVVHEWWGHNEHSRNAATKLAELGYVALAVDMFGDGKTASHPEDATKMMMALMSNPQESAARFEAARTLLANDPHTDPTRIAAIGYCMGGAVSLNAARRGVKLDAIGSFHGNLATQSPMPKGGFKGKILIETGGSDPFVPPEQVEAFKKEMDAAGADYHIDVYPNAKHAFTNPAATAAGEKFSLPLAYDAEADAASWQKLIELLSQVWPEG
jgi:dienelactone hydrolase